MIGKVIVMATISLAFTGSVWAQDVATLLNKPIR